MVCAAYTANRYSTESCVVYPFVVATAISGPAQVYRVWSASFAMVLPTTLTMASVLAPRLWHSFMAAMVSAVSPD